MQFAPPSILTRQGSGTPPGILPFAGAAQPPPPPQPRTCRAGHPLTTYATPRTGFTCDQCSEQIGTGAVMAGCRMCDLDRCIHCDPFALMAAPVWQDYVPTAWRALAQRIRVSLDGGLTLQNVDWNLGGVQPGRAYGYLDTSSCTRVVSGRQTATLHIDTTSDALPLPARLLESSAGAAAQDQQQIRSFDEVKPPPFEAQWCVRVSHVDAQHWNTGSPLAQHVFTLPELLLGGGRVDLPLFSAAGYIVLELEQCPLPTADTVVYRNTSLSVPLRRGVLASSSGFDEGWSGIDPAGGFVQPPSAAIPPPLAAATYQAGQFVDLHVSDASNSNHFNAIAAQLRVEVDGTGGDGDASSLTPSCVRIQIFSATEFLPNLVKQRNAWRRDFEIPPRAAGHRGSTKIAMRTSVVGKFARISLLPRADGKLQRLVLFDTQLQTTPTGGHTLHHSVMRRNLLFSTQLAFVQRSACGAGGGGGFGPYEIETTVAEVHDVVVQFGAGLRCLLGGINIYDGTCVGIFLPNCPEHVIASSACIAIGVASVALATTHSDAVLRHIVQSAPISTMICRNSADVARIISLGVPIARIISLASRDGVAVLLHEDSPHVHLCSWSEVLALSLTPKCAAFSKAITHPLPSDSEESKRHEQRICTIIYTSGSTGMPKGASRTFAEVNKLLTAYAMSGTPGVHLSFQPLSHLSEAVMLPVVLQSGGIVGFASSNGLNIYDDVRALRPTQLFTVPRAFEALLHEYQRDVSAALAAGAADEAAAQRAVLAPGAIAPRIDYRLRFGNRIGSIGTGSAMQSMALRRFLRVLFPTHRVSDGYGATECGTIMFNEVVWVDDAVLLEVPGSESELSSDGIVRGEIAVRTPTMIAGYHGNPEATSRAFDSGYYITGDVVELYARAPPPAGVIGVMASDQLESKMIGSRRGVVLRRFDRCRIVGRTKNVLKLSHGEFVSPEKIEGVLAGAPSAVAIFVHAIPTSDHVVALVAVTPSKDEVEEETIRAAVMAEFRLLAEKAKLPSYEIPRRIVLDRSGEPWSAANGLLNAANKLDRGGLRARFGAALDALYTSSTPPACVAAKARTTIDSTGKRALTEVETAVVEALEMELGEVMSDPLDLEQGIASLGIDSQGIAGVLLALGQRFSTARITPASLAHIEHDVSVTDLVGAVQAAIASPQSSSASAAAQRQLVVAKLENDVEAGIARLRAAVASRTHSLASQQAACAARHAECWSGGDADSAMLPPTVVITGATGFVGASLTMLFIRRLASLNAGSAAKKKCSKRLMEKLPTIYAIATRAPNAAAARVRVLNELQGAMIEPDSAVLLQLLTQVNLEVVHGDLDQPQFGMSPASWAQLQTDCDLVVHTAAAVNWVKPYAALATANIIGTLTALELAAGNNSGTPSPFHYVSTASLARGEADGVSPPSPMQLMSSETAAATCSGYAQTKWVAEALVRRAHEENIVAVTISRPSMITGNSQSGNGNSQQWNARFFRASIELGAFLSGPGRLDMTPVDFVAAAVFHFATARDALGIGIDSADACVHTITNASSCPSFHEVGQYAISPVLAAATAAAGGGSGGAPDYAPMDLTAFKAAIVGAGRTCALYALVQQLVDPNVGMEGPKMSRLDTESLSAEGIDSGMGVDPIELARRYVRAALRDLQQ